AALALLDACVRLLPGVIGKEASAAEESFADGLLEYPQYTRPPVFEGEPIPEVLTSGDHAKVKAWRRAEAERLTTARRLLALPTENSQWTSSNSWKKSRSRSSPPARTFRTFSPATPSWLTSRSSKATRPACRPTKACASAGRGAG